MTNKQKIDLETIKYFIPEDLKKFPIMEDDELMFLEYSDQGKHKDKVDSYKTDGFNILVLGKKWRGIHIHELYEPGILDETMPYFTILGGDDNKPIPQSVVDFLKKEMFKGKDKDKIDKIYTNIKILSKI